MGAAAAAEFTSRDDRPDALIAMGGGCDLARDNQIANALFLIAEFESSSLKRDCRQVAFQGGGSIELIDGATHITMLWSDETVARTVSWLDSEFRVERTDVPDLSDPRLPLAATYFACVLVLLFGLGLFAGSVAPAVRTSGDELRSLVTEIGAALPSAALASLGCFLLLAPFETVLHRVVPSPTRFVIGALITAAILPFTLGFNRLVRRGRWAVAEAKVLLALIIGLSMLVGAALVGVLPGIVVTALPLLVVSLLLFEVFAVGVFFRGANQWLIGIVQAVWLAGLSALFIPLP